MKQSELQALPPRVREKYNRLTADDFKDHPEVIEARRVLNAAEARHQIAVDKLIAFQQRHAALITQRDDAARDVAARDVAALDAERPGQLMHMLLAGDPLNFDQDDARINQREVLARFVERFDVALPAILAHGEALQADVHRHRIDHEEDRLAAIVEKLRVAEAWRQD